MIVTDPQRPTLIVVDRNEVPILAVEFNNQVALSAEMAVDFRQGVLPELGGPYTPYLIYASQDFAYFWDDNQNTPLDTLPTVRMAMNTIIAKYFDGMNDREGGRLTRGMLTYLVERWLFDLVYRGDVALAPDFLKPALSRIGRGEIKRGLYR